MTNPWAPAGIGQVEPPDTGRRTVDATPQDVLRSIWDGLRPELARVVAALGIEPGRAEDVLQDVYLTAWEKPPPVADPADLRRWLFRVAINRCHLEHRKGARWRGVFRGLVRLWTGLDEQSPEAMSRSEEKQRVRAGLQRLEPRLRTILVLRYFAEFDSKEIGRILDLPDSTVRSHLRTARQRLAEELKTTGREGGKRSDTERPEH